jgi:hypothetical protein
VYLAIELVGSLAFMLTFTITAVYYVTEVGMSPLQLSTAAPSGAAHRP